MNDNKYKAKVFCNNCKKEVEIEIFKGHSIYEALNCDYEYRIPCPVCDTRRLEELKVKL